MELLLRRRAFERLAPVLLAPGTVMHAPELLPVEVAQVLRRFERAGTLSAERAGEALADLLALRIVRHPHAPLIARAWSLRDNLTAYHAVYVALAEALQAPLVTMDERLLRAPGHAAEVVVP